MVSVRKENKTVQMQTMAKLSQQTVSYGWTTWYESGFILTWQLNTTLEKKNHHHWCDKPAGEEVQQLYKYSVLFFYQHNLDISFISI